MSTDQTKAATGKYTTDGLPHGSTTLTPHIVVSPAVEALEFYQAVFGARVEDVTRFGSQIAHAELDFGNGRLTLSDPMSDYGLIGAEPERGASYSLATYVPDADGATERAVARGATLREPLATFVSGDRFASILDPFGVRWSVMTRVEDLSPEESRRRVAEWATTLER